MPPLRAAVQSPWRLPQFSRRGDYRSLVAAATALILALSLSSGCSPILQKFAYVRPKMGTGFHIELYAPDARSAQAAADAAFVRIDQLNAELSDYDDHSELSLLSQRTNDGPMKQPAAVSHDLWRVLAESKKISELSDGAFDITVGPFVRLWRRSRALQQLPTPQRLADARASVGYRLMRLDPGTHSVQLMAAHMRLDAGGIAKGLAAEEALHVLAQHGVPRALVGAAGDIAAGEPPPGKPGWVVGFENPGTSNGTNGIYVQLRNQRVSTSGDTYRFVEIDGKRYSHIIDPTTGLGQTRRIEASVISDDGMTADTLALVVCVFGPEKGLALIDQLPATAAIVTIFDSGIPKIYRSARFSRYEMPGRTDPDSLPSATNVPFSQTPAASSVVPATTGAPVPVITLPNQPPTPGVTGDWNGERSKLANDGLTVAAAIYEDYSKNFQGGISTARYASRAFFDLDITCTTDQLLHWHGGTLFFNFLDHEGADGTKTLTGDAQGFDNQDGPRSSQIYQLYYQQLFADDKLRFKVGRIDSTTDFAYVANGSSFLGSSFGYSPAITSFPTYPDPALGAVLFWTPDEHWYATGGISYANHSDRTGILSGAPYQARESSGGVFAAAEVGARWTLGSGQLPGRVGLGAYDNTGAFRRFDGTEQRGASGIFAVFDQTLWQVQPAASDAGAAPANIGMFAQYGLADRDISAIDQHVGAGFQWTGPIPGKSRAADVLGVGASFVHFSGETGFARNYEVAIETFYKLQMTPWFNLQPDLSYILNPGGGQRDALVATIRAELDF